MTTDSKSFFFKGADYTNLQIPISHSSRLTTEVLFHFRLLLSFLVENLIKEGRVCRARLAELFVEAG